MWKHLTEDEWQNIVNNNKVSIFYSVKYLKVVSETYNLKINYLGYYYKSRVISILSFYTRGKNIILPEGFSYSPFYIESNLSEQIYFNLCNSLIQNLTSNFKKINFKLEIDFYDVRPFIWNNFKIQIKYTRIKTQSTKSHNSVYKNIRKIKSLQNYTFSLESVTPESLSLNLEFLKKLGSTPSTIIKYENLIRGWESIGVLKSFSLYNETKLITSNLVLLDYKLSKIYTILLNNVKIDEKYAHTYLYEQMIEWAKENNFKEIDFCGANIPGISLFKSNFNTDLKMYFKISYSPMIGMVKTSKEVIFKQLYAVRCSLLKIFKWK